MNTAITADANAVGGFFDAFHASVGSPKLQTLDVSGNPLTNPRAISKLARVFTRQSGCCWPMLQHLNLASEPQQITWML